MAEGLSTRLSLRVFGHRNGAYAHGVEPPCRRFIGYGLNYDLGRKRCKTLSHISHPLLQTAEA